MLQTIKYDGGKLYIIDQTKLPVVNETIEIKNAEECFDAIKRLKIRGAPAIGIAAAYGIFLGVKDVEEDDFDKFYKKFTKIKEYLSSSRPTAVNL